VEKINQIRNVSIWIFILPVTALNLCLFVSVNYFLFENTIFQVDEIGKSAFTIPYIDGGVSGYADCPTSFCELISPPCTVILDRFHTSLKNV